ncbi:MAG: LysM peptidoglycan-binding domain-containing protein [Planctomycetia bacterium]
MQQIEKYGVIALVFLLVTIVAVSFWGDSKSPGFWSRLTGGQKEEVAQAAATTSDESAAQVDPSATVENDPLAQARELPTGDLVAGAVANQAAGEASAAAPSATRLETTYVVKSGDSLARIARKELGSEARWKEIPDLNPGVTPQNLKLGQSLLLPVGAAPASSASTAPVAASVPARVAPKSKVEAKPKAAVAAKAPAAAQPASAPKPKSGRVYTVKSGDTLVRIAERECGSAKMVGQIKALNPGLDPDKIKVGAKITLPGQGGALVASAAAPRSKSKVQ